MCVCFGSVEKTNADYYYSGERKENQRPQSLCGGRDCQRTKGRRNKGKGQKGLRICRAIEGGVVIREEETAEAAAAAVSYPSAENSNKMKEARKHANGEKWEKKKKKLKKERMRH